MTQQQHPITLPPKLMQKWAEQFEAGGSLLSLFEDIYRAGADAELEACCEWIPKWTPWDADKLRAARRPKPPSLAETATYELDEAVMRGDCISTTDAMPHLRAALKRLTELENQPQS